MGLDVHSQRKEIWLTSICAGVLSRFVCVLTSFRIKVFVLRGSCNFQISEISPQRLFSRVYPTPQVTVSVRPFVDPSHFEFDFFAFLSLTLPLVVYILIKYKSLSYGQTD